ncbi:MAG: HDIG domain-containing protein [Anaeromyxobacter sp.]|nr:HDIG domain-containing protein [Anaeromyxobacter sp.]MBL0278632.1 HDIG domain-containing protein [Anaeromyxobacter sp.]
MLALLVLLAAVAAAAAALLGPAPAGHLPGPDDLGRPAPVTVRADRDHDLEDLEATGRRRAAAAAAERPVYDEDAGAADEAAARIHAAFALMREEEEALRGQRPVVDAAELGRRYAAQRDAFVARLQVLVRDEDLAALAAARFSEVVEREAAALAARGLEGLVVGDRALLPAAREPGLTVRTLRDGEVTGERVLTDLALVRDLATARGEVAGAAAARLAGQPPALRAAVLHLALGASRPTLVHNQGETERRRAEAAARVRPVGLAVHRGERIVVAGERLEPRHLAVFEAIRARARAEQPDLVRLGVAALVALLALALWRYAAAALPGFHPSVKDAALLAALLVGGVALAAAGQQVADLLGDRLPGLPQAAALALLPLAAGAVVARQALGAEAALVLAVATGLGVGLAAGASLPLALHATVTSLAAAAVGGRWRPRAGLLRAGAAAGLSGALLAAATALQAGRSGTEVVVLAGAAMASGLLLLPPLAWLALQVAAGLLGYLSDGRLRQLANLNHPALKELIVQAPGTYHHAILVGSLVEAGARAIGADDLLGRVGAYYHDLGKIKNPLYFAENQRGRNEHDGLAPSMSALVVKRHVGDGLELARRWRLPRAVAEIIAQHHGTRLIGYFWAKQQKLAEAGEAAGPADEALFRYAGPKPRSREAALVMLADVCEASARTLEAPSVAALEAMVQLRVREVVAEGQLDECELTLGELTAVSRALVDGLVGFHQAGQLVGPPPEAAPARPAVHLVGRP